MKPSTTTPTPRANPSDLLADAESRYSDLVMHCDRAIMIVRDSQIVVANDAAIGLLGATSAAQVTGQRIGAFVTAWQDSLQHNPGHHKQIEMKLARLDKAIISVSLDLLPCRHEGHESLQVLLRDVSERKLLEGRLQFLVRHDNLTELPNRTEFRERLIGAMARARRNSRLVAVMLINLDRFKSVNARHGSEKADLILQEVARRLKDSVRLADSVARIAGDEFGLILEAIDQREQTAVVANRVLPQLRAPIEIAGVPIVITASAGIAAFPSDGEDIDALLRKADVAMYAAKEAGGNGFRFYFADMEAISQRDNVRRQQTATRLAKLTAREREVMEVLIEGNSNKAMAYLLGASPRTIENHRAKVMEKMEADSLPDLVRMVLDLRQAEK